eukprot:5970015-Amphidinium_carterae.1
MCSCVLSLARFGSSCEGPKFTWWTMPQKRFANGLWWRRILVGFEKSARSTGRTVQYGSFLKPSHRDGSVMGCQEVVKKGRQSRQGLLEMLCVLLNFTVWNLRPREVVQAHCPFHVVACSIGDDSSRTGMLVGLLALSLKFVDWLYGSAYVHTERLCTHGHCKDHIAHSQSFPSCLTQSVEAVPGHCEDRPPEKNGCRHVGHVALTPEIEKRLPPPFWLTRGNYQWSLWRESMCVSVDCHSLWTVTASQCSAVWRTPTTILVCSAMKRFLVPKGTNQPSNPGPAQRAQVAEEGG